MSGVLEVQTENAVEKKEAERSGDPGVGTWALPEVPASGGRGGSRGGAVAPSQGKRGHPRVTSNAQAVSKRWGQAISAGFGLSPPPPPNNDRGKENKYKINR